MGDSVPLEETPDAVPGADPDPVPGADPGQASAETGVPLSGGSLLGDQIITRVFSSTITFLTQYGWYGMLVLVLVGVAWVKLKPHILAWLKKREEWIEEQNFDPVKAESFQDGMLQARERMQREQDRKAAENQQKREELREAERDDKIEQWEQFQVVTKSKRPKPKSDSGMPPSRRDYFPMSGGGGGGGYRPARRTFGGGGGGG